MPRAFRSIFVYVYFSEPHFLATKILVVEPGESERSGRFPRGLTAASPSASTHPSVSGQPLVPSTRLGAPVMGSGPTTTLSTPQDRFRDAMLALNKKDTRERGRGGHNARGTQQAPRLATSPNTIPTIQPKMQPHATGTISQGTGNSRPTPSRSPGPIQLLSQWCQENHFNPIWQLKQRPGTGLFGGEVKLREQSVKTDREYGTEHRAKTALAQKALDVVRARDWRLATPRLTNEAVPRRRRDTRALQHSPDAIMTDAGATAQNPRLERDDRARESAALLDHVRQVAGIAVPDPSAENPQAARAFLEGLAAGVRLADPSFRGRASRSRSPFSRAPTARYRERSPFRSGGDANGHPRRRRGGIRRHTDRYRPGPSRGYGGE
jgi:hypothetical protein